MNSTNEKNTKLLRISISFSFEHFRLSSYLGTNCKIFGFYAVWCCFAFVLFWLTNSSSRGVTISFPE